MLTSSAVLTPAPLCQSAGLALCVSRGCVRAGLAAELLQDGGLLRRVASQGSRVPFWNLGASRRCLSISCFPGRVVPWGCLPFFACHGSDRNKQGGGKSYPPALHGSPTPPAKAKEETGEGTPVPNLTSHQARQHQVPVPKQNAGSLPGTLLPCGGSLE